MARRADPDTRNAVSVYVRVFVYGVGLRESVQSLPHDVSFRDRLTEHRTSPVPIVTVDENAIPAGT